MTAAQRRQSLTKAFSDRFGSLPLLWCRAPGRVDLMGSHTDYNMGAVLTLPIDRDTWIAARPNGSRIVNLYSLNLTAGASFSLDSREVDPVQPWSNYVHGVAVMLKDEGLPISGFDGLIHSTIPLRSGLSSSAALECATATIFESLSGWQLPALRKAQLCQQAENQFVGVNCGILDQFTSCFGKQGCALFLDCRDLTSHPVPIADGVQVVVGDTKSKRELAYSAYNERREQCMDGARLLGATSLREVSPQQFAANEHKLPLIVAKRCRFIIEEHARVFALTRALPIADHHAVSQLTAASFAGACQLFEIASPAMHAMLDAMLAAPGVIGARQAGAGFGGCLIAFVETSKVETFAASVCSRYHSATGNRPEVFPVTAAAGTGTLRTV